MKRNEKVVTDLPKAKLIAVNLLPSDIERFKQADAQVIQRYSATDMGLKEGKIHRDTTTRLFMELCFAATEILGSEVAVVGVPTLVKMSKLDNSRNQRYHPSAIAIVEAFIKVCIEGNLSVEVK